MASWNFRRGLCLYQLKRQMDLANMRNLSTTVKKLGGGYVAHGGDVVKVPTKLDIGNREVIISQFFKELKGLKLLYLSGGRIRDQR